MEPPGDVNLVPFTQYKPVRLAQYKPFSCEHCSRRFSGNHLCKRHIEAHHPYRRMQFTWRRYPWRSKVYCEGESVVKRFHGIESNLRIEPIAKTNQTTTPTLAPASIENARATGETSSHVRNRHASLNNNSVVGIAASRVYSDNQRKWNTLEATNVMTTMINGTGPIDADKVIKGMITMVNAMGKTIEAAKAIELITAFNDELTTLHAAKAVNLSTTLDAATKMELEWLGYKAKHIEGRI